MDRPVYGRRLQLPLQQQMLEIGQMAQRELVQAHRSENGDHIAADGKCPIASPLCADAPALLLPRVLGIGFGDLSTRRTQCGFAPDAKEARHRDQALERRLGRGHRPEEIGEIPVREPSEVVEDAVSHFLGYHRRTRLDLPSVLRCIEPLLMNPPRSG